jgi:prevent-host-death family protein
VSEVDAVKANMVKAMKQVALSEIKDDLSKYLRLAENQQIIITRHGKPAGVLVGFASEDDWFDYKLENDPRFLQRIARARKSLQTGKGINLEDVYLEPKARPRRNSARSRKSRRRRADAG